MKTMRTVVGSYGGFRVGEHYAFRFSPHGPWFYGALSEIRPRAESSHFKMRTLRRDGTEVVRWCSHEDLMPYEGPPRATLGVIELPPQEGTR